MLKKIEIKTNQKESNVCHDVATTFLWAIGNDKISKLILKTKTKSLESKTFKEWINLIHEKHSNGPTINSISIVIK